MDYRKWWAQRGYKSPDKPKLPSARPDPRQFGRRKADRDYSRTPTTIAIFCIAAAVICFTAGYWLDDPEEGSAIAFIIGFGLLFVALAAAHEAFGYDPDEEI